MQSMLPGFDGFRTSGLVNACHSASVSQEYFCFRVPGLLQTARPVQLGPWLQV
jgi:hypothetical protein